MKGRAMNIKLVEQGRTARYGIALGIVRLFAAGNFDPRRLRGWRGSL